MVEAEQEAAEILHTAEIEAKVIAELNISFRDRGQQNQTDLYNYALRQEALVVDKHNFKLAHSITSTLTSVLVHPIDPVLARRMDNFVTISTVGATGPYGLGQMRDDNPCNYCFKLACTCNKVVSKLTPINSTVRN